MNDRPCTSESTLDKYGKTQIVGQPVNNDPSVTLCARNDNQTGIVRGIVNRQTFSCALSSIGETREHCNLRESGHFSIIRCTMAWIGLEGIQEGKGAIGGEHGTITVCVCVYVTMVSLPFCLRRLCRASELFSGQFELEESGEFGEVEGDLELGLEREGREPGQHCFPLKILCYRTYQGWFLVWGNIMALIWFDPIRLWRQVDNLLVLSGIRFLRKRTGGAPKLVRWFEVCKTFLAQHIRKYLYTCASSSSSLNRPAAESRK